MRGGEGRGWGCFLALAPVSAYLTDRRGGAYLRTWGSRRAIGREARRHREGIDLRRDIQAGRREAEAGRGASPGWRLEEGEASRRESRLEVSRRRRVASREACQGLERGTGNNNVPKRAARKSQSHEWDRSQERDMKASG
ncbi:hypothetical protein MPTK1_4g21090 [Marchantia polymorpha subsp. ruderalis]|uniref:Uncharacterized protein n=2 Tax=Marchantia polymorpha TaxID=3197 RepID=A0AAF6BC72_MARPO|nr:hypothetical protein MARPO_0101s0055 [Marchantia polymorpha]BBN09606.1 hypothetical protein Mp_4g21090 [Marchantia polymorpha subsp. ruderalis]|eukprot:PTQ32264.1 hypothetical protein MARPO_0101s0055 [Marchantia polymorpha]